MKSKYLVEIVKRAQPELIVKQMGPMDITKANKVDMGANINLNYTDYFTRIVKEKSLCLK